MHNPILMVDEYARWRVLLDRPSEDARGVERLRHHRRTAARSVPASEGLQLGGELQRTLRPGGTSQQRRIIGIAHEQVRVFYLVLGVNQQHAARLKRVIEKAHHATTQRRLQIAQQAAADDEIKVRIRWVLKQIVRGEGNDIAQLLTHTIMTIFAHEEALETLLGYRCCNLLRIQPIARLLQHVCGYLAGEYLQLPSVAVPSGVLDQQHRQRIGFLAAGATDRPDADFLPRLFAREDLVQQLLDGIAVAKEFGDVEQQILVKRAWLLGTCAQHPEIHLQ